MNSNPRLRYEMNSLVVPGDRLGPMTTVNKISPGPGTFVRRGHLYASTAGRLSMRQQQQQQQNEHNESVIAVVPQQQRQQQQQQQQQRQQQQPDFASRRVITVGQIVLAKVQRVSWTQAHVSIFATETGGTLAYPAEALVRREDIVSVVPGTSTTSTSNSTTTTAESKTSWQVMEAVRPGDWIVARVLSLGDTQRYMLTLAEPQLGVWHAVSSKGTVLQPKTWNTMVCPETGLIETRKCAKPRS